MSGNQRTVAFFCATYLRAEMHHVFRQITHLQGYDAAVITEKDLGRPEFAYSRLVEVPRDSWRWLRRSVERWGGGKPWQAGNGEVRRLNRALRDLKADALHFFFGNVAVHYQTWFRNLDLPLVVSFHGADLAGRMQTRAYRAVMADVFHRADLLVARSEALLDQLEVYGAPRTKLRLQRTVLGEDLLLSAPTIEDQPDNGPYLLQACRLIPKKGLRSTLNAFAELYPEFPTLRLKIAGEGPMLLELRAKAIELGISDRVDFEGFVSQQDLRGLMSRSLAFVHPSETIMGDTEGIPNSLLEAMAAGCAVISTRHGGIPEIVIDGENGLLVLERDYHALASAIRSVVTNKSLQAALGTAAQQTIREEFSAQAMSSIYDELFNVS